MQDIQGIRIEKLYRGLSLVITTKTGEIHTFKLSSSNAKRLMESLFRVVSPNWGGEREGSGRPPED